MLKAQLYDLMELNKPKQKCCTNGETYAVHPSMNHTELIWADVKQWVASKNTTFKILNYKQLFRQIFEETAKKYGRIYVSVWKN
jgi:hypothetical protein